MTLISPGFYDIETLPNADSDLLVPYSTTGWAGMDVLFATIDGEDTELPYFADGFSGYLPEAAYDHPFHRVETVLSGEFGTTRRIGLLAFQVGQIVHWATPRDAQEWERAHIRKIMDWKPPMPQDRPTEGWTHEDYAALYAEVRAEGAARLEAEVKALASAITIQNEAVQLYVQRESGLAEGTGWLGPLLGLAIDTKVEDDYTRQPHDVVAVVRQTDGSEALMRGAGASVYTVATRESIL